MKQLRWKSKAAWLVLLAQLGLIAALMFNDGTVTAIKVVGMAFITVAEAFGVFNNPENKDKF